MLTIASKRSLTIPYLLKIAVYIRAVQPLSSLVFTSSSILMASHTSSEGFRLTEFEKVKDQNQRGTGHKKEHHYSDEFL